jgi:ribonuclease D
VLDRAEGIDRADWPRQPKFSRLDDNQQALADCLMAIARLTCAENDIALASVAGKKDIDALVTGQGESKLMQGWRHEMLGRRLQDFLDGRSRLACRDGRLEIEADE